MGLSPTRIALLAGRIEDAPIFAAMQADKCLEAGDLNGKAVWMRVIAANKELQDRRPPSRGETVH